MKGSATGPKKKTQRAAICMLNRVSFSRPIPKEARKSKVHSGSQVTVYVSTKRKMVTVALWQSSMFFLSKL